MKKHVKTLIIIEDDEILLDSYKYYIKSFDDYVLKGAYRTIENALLEYETIYPDIIISDISLPEMSGIDGLEKFKALDKEVKIMMISVHDDIDYIKKAINNNANGYLTKPVNKISFKKALDELINNGAPLSSDVSKKVISLLQDKNHEMFSERENEILHFFTKGHTYKSIAEKLYITPSTINFHIQNIYTKLNVNSKSEALKVLAELNY